MSRKTVSAIMLCLLIVSMLALAFKIQLVKADGGTITINADGSVEGTTDIQTADNVTYVFTANISDPIIVQRDNITIDGNGYTLQGTENGNGNGIDLSGRTNVTLQKMAITSFAYGIYFDSSSSNSVTGNKLTSNWAGIALNSSSNNNISGNNIANNSNGILLDYSSINNISGNKLTSNWAGIYLLSSSSNSINGNSMTANDLGICLFESSSNNSITGNNMANNVDGIALYSYSSNNSITGNNITNNDVGIWLDFSCSNNSIFHNNFMGNVAQARTDGFPNTWDDGYPSGGNYWSDYNGTDSHDGPYQNITGSDEIGDTPYVIDANNTDNYPLMSPYINSHVVGDLNGDGKVGLDDLVLLAKAYDSKPGDPNWNPAADMAPPYGVIGLTDLVTLAMHYGQQSP